MKRLTLIVLALMLLTGAAQAAGLGMTTFNFLLFYTGYLETAGVVHYEPSLADDWENQSSILTPITKHCSLDIRQQDGMLTRLEIVSGERDNEDERAVDSFSCFIGALTLFNLDMSIDEVSDFLTEISQNPTGIMSNGINYRFVTGQPFTSVVSLEITPAI